MMDEAPTVLAYEQQRDPPYLVREPGRVALVMPGTPRWLGVVMVALQAVSCVLLSAFAVMFLRQLWRGPAGPTPPGTNAALAFLIGLPVLFITFLGLQVRWWLTVSRHAPVVEIRGDELLWSFPGFWTTKLRRVPLTRVRDVSLRGTRTIGRLWVDRVRLEFTDRRAFERTFFTTDPAFAEQAREAFAAALADARRQTP
jgi:hypothetical protein